MLFATLDSTFGGMKRTVKMYLLEDHIHGGLVVSTPSWLWLKMGEQGAEPIHGKLNSLARTYSGIRDPKLKPLKSIMKEHYLNISPHLSTAVSP